MAEYIEHSCRFYLDKKKRYCRLMPRKGQDYCPEHSCVMGVQEGRKRIPCPLNPNHNCNEDELKSHLKKCNVTKIRQSTEKLPYFVKNINKGCLDDCKEDSLSSSGSVKDLTSEKLRMMIEKVNKLYSEVVENIDKLYLEHPNIKKEIVGGLDLDLTEALGNQTVLKKEMLQQASLVGQLHDLGLLSTPHQFVELGAGKGKLSHWIQKASQDFAENHFLLVERGSVRYKVDPEGRRENFERIKIDIQDFCLGKVPRIQEQDSSVVVVGKHLCGGATDLGIRCAVHTLDQPCSTVIIDKSHTSSLQTLTTTENNIFLKSPNDQSEPSSQTSTKEKEINQIEKVMTEKSSCSSEKPSKVMQNEESFSKNGECFYDSSDPPAKVRRVEGEKQPNRKFEGLMIALCCHHRCTWDTFVGRDFMRMHGLNEEDFDLLTRLSSWATCSKSRTKGKTSNKKSINLDKDKSFKTDIPHELKNETQEHSEIKDENTDEQHAVEDLIKINVQESVNLRENLTIPERELIGRKAKRLIDMGRIEYLRSKGLKCFLREYIHEDITPENIVLIAINAP